RRSASALIMRHKSCFRPITTHFQTMPRKSYRWSRFWVPREGAFSFDSEGFLLAPPEEHSRRRVYRTDAVEFREIKERQCLILLGEPGIGKSFAVRSEAEAVNCPLRNLGSYASEERLIKDVFSSQEFLRWKKSHNKAHL